MSQRIIKFRAWDKEKQVMMTGTNQYGCDEPNLGGRCYSAGSFTRLWEALARFKESDRFILMQYTGLKDKNGKEIYEGDVVKEKFNYSGIRLFKIIWRIDLACFILTNSLNKKNWYPLSSRTDVEKPKCNYLEVIGNIYEHSHLLKEKA